MSVAVCGDGSHAALERSHPRCPMAALFTSKLELKALGMFQVTRLLSKGRRKQWMDMGWVRMKRQRHHME